MLSSCIEVEGINNGLAVHFGLLRSGNTSSSSKSGIERKGNRPTSTIDPLWRGEKGTDVTYVREKEKKKKKQ
jgi:hypothetical protein